ncbi:SH3 domain-containing protein [Limisalsivibrio acetivorans]|uniref:SH3 domain-containing protein n=1 Tax=Limisalsivibrio acetivorans TaxID=1304888 RepID=UPI0003B6EC7A|nr:SH3 domain-containing protein [Limisalsivibrio acetivorans]
MSRTFILILLTATLYGCAGVDNTPPMEKRVDDLTILLVRHQKVIAEMAERQQAIETKLSANEKSIERLAVKSEEVLEKTNTLAEKALELVEQRESKLVEGGDGLRIYAYVRPLLLNVRKDADPRSDVVTQLVHNSRVSIEEEVFTINGTWRKVRYQNTEGYVKSSLLSRKPVMQLDKRGRVSPPVLNIREKPDHQSPVIMKLKGGEDLALLKEIKDSKGFWWQIRKDGRIGYARGRYIKVLP